MSATHSNQKNKQISCMRVSKIIFNMCLSCSSSTICLLLKIHFSLLCLSSFHYLWGHFTANNHTYYNLPKKSSTVNSWDDIMYRRQESITVGLSVRSICWCTEGRQTYGWHCFLLHYTGSGRGRECGYWGEMTRSRKFIFPRHLHELCISALLLSLVFHVLVSF